jgi:hypothetical protein
MGTRGFLGFVADDTEKIAYCHFDSYPSGLGLATLRWLRAAMDAPDVLRKRIVELRVVDPDSHPTEADIERLSRYADTGVSTKRLDDWYVLLRETQGNPHAMLDAGVIEDASGFPADSLFAEWGYVVDLDAMTFEVYEGFQNNRHSKGRFARRPVPQHSSSLPTYYPVALIRSWPLTELPSDDEFVAELEGGEDE